MNGNELVRACDDYLTLKQVFHYRNNSGAIKMPHGSFVRYGAKGSPDIIVVTDGTYIGIECKMGSGRQSPDQKAFESALTAAGGEYYIIRSVDELQKIIDHV
jgi:hypothetical protein